VRCRARQLFFRTTRLERAHRYKHRHDVDKRWKLILEARSNNASVGSITGSIGSIGSITEAIQVYPIEEEEDEALAMKRARSVSQVCHIFNPESRNAIVLWIDPATLFSGHH
jgi:hypothetical protein